MTHLIKIVLAEPSPIIRNGILSILHHFNRIQTEVYEVNEVEQLKSALQWRKPDLLLVNPMVLNLFSLQQIRKEAANQSLKCVALQSALADNSLFKHFDEIIGLYDSIEQINEKLTRLVSLPEEENRLESLSVREKEIVVCIVKGMINRQIADKLHLSTHTVVSHRRNIATKLQIHSTSGLTIYAIVNKLVTMEEIKF
ncbi:MAG: LuxR C-terminal-related transcriptional regulator [Candidatus Symbiothrix sp.]|jgi:DNA-binding NarL/FixJ family response regulator|nr:LuxR C-terminal-related transcriptional regulator [Candidatus Symbiothrix sp.]